ncbi:hypothetical protein K144316041_p21670 (plasmid) [Clostridium tetani]|uniref:hypothetical protein n=1 Tax=Clostridium tetani TaxID=1513 RepID=UPI0029535DAF|nr:hypothetical protein [Clostridium tetani]BDR74328.1 hypothetical protein K144316041_p21670 [Clostridium tetani]
MNVFKKTVSARDNRFLADIKKVYNSKIYSKARRIYIEEGKEQALEYINRFGDFEEVLKIINKQNN